MQNAEQSLLEELIHNLNQLLSEKLELEASGLIGATELHPEHRQAPGIPCINSRFAGTTPSSDLSLVRNSRFLCKT
jgi:hypothetical protein